MRTDRLIPRMMADVHCQAMVNEALAAKLLDLSRALQSLPEELRRISSSMSELADMRSSR